MPLMCLLKIIYLILKDTGLVVKQMAVTTQKVILDMKLEKMESVSYVITLRLNI